MTAPTLAEIAEILRQLLTGAVSRKDASTWAHQWVLADDPGVEDDVAWRALEELGAAHLRTDDTEFLYHDIDFHAWLDELENAIDARS